MHFNRRINSMNVENGIELVDRNFNQFNHSMFAKCFFSRYTSLLLYFKKHTLVD
jgi:hypothetical protein